MSELPQERSIGGLTGGRMILMGDEVLGVCVVLGTAHRVKVEPGQVKTYTSGALAQVAFPQLTPDQREFLISGISPAGWMGIPT